MQSIQLDPPAVAIITGAWDDLPALFTRLGLPFRLLGGTLAACEDPKALEGCRALYIACGAEYPLSEGTSRVLRRFVADGGGLYLSDLAAVPLQRLFPDALHAEMVDYESNNHAQVSDPGLAELLGETITLHMDYPNAQGIQSVGQNVKVLIRGPRKDRLDEQSYPYLVTFPFGQGEVLYTVFHNAHQVDETEEKLLEYLILRPLLVGLRREVAQLFAENQASLQKEIISAAAAGQTGKRMGLYLHKNQTLEVVLHWQGGALGMQVFDPAGKRYRYLSSDHAPLCLSLPVKSEGKWTVAIRGMREGGHLTPYVLGLGMK